MTAEEAKQKPAGRAETYAQIAAILRLDWLPAAALKEEAPEAPQEESSDGPLAEYSVGRLVRRG
jgi:hypothetical protein